MSDTAASNEKQGGPVRVPASRALLVVALIALTAFGCLAATVSAFPRNAFDDVVRSAAGAANSAGGTAFFSLVSTVGSVTPMIAYAVIAVAFVAISRRALAPLATLVAPGVAVLAYLGVKSVVLRTRPSGAGNAFEGTYSFPSAHATTSSAVCFAVAFLVYREGLVSGVAAASAAAVTCLLIGLSRISLDVHWATDVMGGWCLGVAIGAAASALYVAAGDAAHTHSLARSRR